LPKLLLAAPEYLIFPIVPLLPLLPQDEQKQIKDMKELSPTERKELLKQLLNDAIKSHNIY
jgi:ribonuclease HII